MYFFTYNDELRDGAGAQVQRILSIFLLAYKYGFGYIHKSFFTIEHGFDEHLLERFNRMIELFPLGNCPSHFDDVKEIVFFTRDVLVHFLQNPTDKNVLIIVSNCPIIDHEPIILLHDPYPIKFSWIDEQMNEKIQIAFHIRRGDVSKTENQDRYVEISYYLECIEALKVIFVDKPYHIHLFSESNILTELGHIDSNIILHIDEDVVDSFKFLVNCDLLFAGFSSFSYSASMLRRKGVVLYKKFWHSFSPKALCIDRSSDILVYKNCILDFVVSKNEFKM